MLGAFGGVVFAGTTGKLSGIPLLGNMFSASPGERTVSVPKGTAVKLILAEGLDAGGSKVGDEVDLLVAEDVVVDGVVVIPRGTMAKGKVEVSRGASLLASMSNRPARLAVSLDHLKLKKQVLTSSQVAEQAVVLEPVTGNKEGYYEFTQENTADRVNAAKIDQLWEDPKSREALATIAEKMAAGESLDGVDTDVKKVADSLGLKKASAVAEKSGAGGNGLTLGKAVDAVVSGNLGGLVGADRVLAAQAMGEISDVVSSVDHKVRGVFKARTVRASIGTPVAAKVGVGFDWVVKVK